MDSLMCKIVRRLRGARTLLLCEMRHNDESTPMPKYLVIADYDGIIPVIEPKTKLDVLARATEQFVALGGAEAMRQREGKPPLIVPVPAAAARKYVLVHCVYCDEPPRKLATIRQAKRMADCFTETTRRAVLALCRQPQYKQAVTLRDVERLAIGAQLSRDDATMLVDTYAPSLRRSVCMRNLLLYGLTRRDDFNADAAHHFIFLNDNRDDAAPTNITMTVARARYYDAVPLGVAGSRVRLRQTPHIDAMWREFAGEFDALVGHMRYSSSTCAVSSTPILASVQKTVAHAFDIGDGKYVKNRRDALLERYIASMASARWRLIGAAGDARVVLEALATRLNDDDEYLFVAPTISLAAEAEAVLCREVVAFDDIGDVVVVVADIVVVLLFTHCAGIDTVAHLVAARPSARYIFVGDPFAVHGSARDCDRGRVMRDLVWAARSGARGMTYEALFVNGVRGRLGELEAAEHARLYAPRAATVPDRLLLPPVDTPLTLVGAVTESAVRAAVPTAKTSVVGSLLLLEDLGCVVRVRSRHELVRALPPADRDVTPADLQAAPRVLAVDAPRGYVFVDTLLLDHRRCCRVSEENLVCLSAHRARSVDVVAARDLARVLASPLVDEARFIVTPSTCVDDVRAAFACARRLRVDDRVTEALERRPNYRAFTVLTQLCKSAAVPLDALTLSHALLMPERAAATDESVEDVRYLGVVAEHRTSFTLAALRDGERRFLGRHDAEPAPVVDDDDDDDLPPIFDGELALSQAALDALVPHALRVADVLEARFYALAAVAGMTHLRTLNAEDEFVTSFGSAAYEAAFVSLMCHVFAPSSPEDHASAERALYMARARHRHVDIERARAHAARHEAAVLRFYEHFTPLASSDTDNSDDYEPHPFHVKIMQLRNALTPC